jgi:hypothetical protein
MSKHAQVSSAILIEVRIEVCGIHILPVTHRKPSCLVMAAISTTPPTDFGRNTVDRMKPIVVSTRKRARSIASWIGMAGTASVADDTTLPMLDLGRGRTKTGRFWCYVRNDRAFGGQAPPTVPYCYSPDREGQHPRRHLTSFRSIHQADGYAGYAAL